MNDVSPFNIEDAVKKLRNRSSTKVLKYEKKSYKYYLQPTPPEKRRKQKKRRPISL